MNSQSSPRVRDQACKPEVLNFNTTGLLFSYEFNYPWSNLPSSWQQQGVSHDGRSIAHHLPGGQPPELPLAWSPSVKGTSRVISSPISAKPGARYGGLVMVRVEDRMVFQSMLRPNIQQAGTMPAFLKTEMPILPVSNKQEMATLSAVFILLLPMAVQPVEAGKKYLPPG